MVWHRTRMDSHYWAWVTQAQHTVPTVTHTPPPESRVELGPGAVALFKYPIRCLTHKRPGHPHRGPLCMALHAPEALPSELGPAL